MPGTALSNWSGYFATTGSAGATLVGLLFVVVTLATGLPTKRTMEIARASMTPALYSFGGVLFQSMIALAPWPSDRPAGMVFLVVGILGLVYRVSTVRLRSGLHLRAISSPLDWIFHNVVPVLGSVCVIAGGVGLTGGEAFGPFAIAGASMLLLLSGIYRTWGQTLALIQLQEK